MSGYSKPPKKLWVRIFVLIMALAMIGSFIMMIIR